MFFITLTKWKQAPKKEVVNKATKTFEKLEKQGIKTQIYWTLGSYDAVAVIEAPSEKDAMKMLIGFQGIVETQTLTAVPREEAIKLL